MKKGLLILLLLLLSVAGFSQAITGDNFRSNLEYLATNFPQEKIYIHYDKSSYNAGEFIYFKAYLSEGINASAISKTLYVDFTDSAGKLMQHQVLPIEQAGAYGSFEIPYKYTAERIGIKVYTRWMLNFDSSFLYQKDIKISQTKKLKKAPPAQQAVSLQFFPEGGSSIAGVNGIIAFKANYSNGLPAAITGKIVDQAGNTVTTIKTEHDGMGVFLLEPVAGNTYKAQWKDAANKTYETALPGVLTEGLNLSISNAPGKKNFTIRRSQASGGRFIKGYIVATMQQNLVYMASVNLENTTAAAGNIPTVELPSGILTVTVFDSSWIAVAERICFVNNLDYRFEPEAGFASLSFSKRSANMLSVFVPAGIRANLSLSVTDGASQTDSSDNIISRLLLTSDIKGDIYRAHYYLSDTTQTIVNHLDLVMLTHGWRRIKWDDLIKTKMPVVKYPNDVEYLTLRGKVFGMTQQDSKTGAVLMLIMEKGKDKAREMEQIVVQPDGNFNMAEKLLYDTTKVFYKLVASEFASNTSEVSFNNGFLPATQIKTGYTPPVYYTADTSQDERSRWFTEQQAMLAKMLYDNELEEVVVKAKAKAAVQILDEKYANGLFAGGDAYQFDVANDPRSNTLSLFTYLQGKVAGLQINTTSGSVGGQPSVTWRGQVPQFFLDQSAVDISQLSNVNMNQVAYVKVFRPPFFGGIGGAPGGAIVVYTKQGGDITSPGKTRENPMPYKMVIGYTAAKDYFMPNYNSLNNRTDGDDLRSTLLWKPDLIFDGKITTLRIPFYNNDITTSYRIILEGMDSDGRLTRIEKIIE